MNWKCVMMLGAMVVTGGNNQMWAGVLVEEDFRYPDGNLVGASLSPWFAHSQAGNGPVQVLDGRLQLSGSGAEDVSMLLPGAPYAASGSLVRLYAGFLLRAEELPSLAGTYLAHFRNNTTAHRGRLWVSRSADNPDSLRLGIGNGAGADAGSGPWPTELELGRDYRVVLRYEVGTGQTALWIDPVAESDPPVLASDTPSPLDIVHWCFRQSAEIGEMRLDEFRLGEAFNEVAGGVPLLRIVRIGGEVDLSWPESAADLRLEEATELGGDTWIMSEGQAVLEGGRYHLRKPIVGGAMFYRLRP